MTKKKAAKKAPKQKRKFTDILAKRTGEPRVDAPVVPPRVNTFAMRRMMLGVLNPYETFCDPGFGGWGYGRLLYRNSALAKVETWKPGQIGTMIRPIVALAVEVLLDNVRGPIKLPPKPEERHYVEVITNLWHEFGPNFHHLIDAKKILADSGLKESDLTPARLEIARWRHHFRMPLRFVPSDHSKPDWHSDDDVQKNGKPESPEKVKDKPTKKIGPAQKKPGVITRIIELLRDATKKKPITKEEVLADLVKKFPEREAQGMKNTIGSQIPSGLRTEKKLICQTNGKSGWWLQ